VTAHDQTPLTASTLCNCTDCGAVVEGAHICSPPPAPPSQLHMVVLHAIRRRVVEALARGRKGR
jgi:hypothetical protein